MTKSETHPAIKGMNAKVRQHKVRRVVHRMGMLKTNLHSGEMMRMPFSANYSCFFVPPFVVFVVPEGMSMVVVVVVPMGEILLFHFFQPILANDEIFFLNF